MAAPRETYAFIPPPPLPEFYLPKSKLKAMANQDEKVSATSSSSSTPAMALVKAKTKTSNAPQQTGKHGRTQDEIMYRSHRLSLSTSGPIFAVPSEAVRRGEVDVPPLAVYHICRVCLRPRSARYHREHPIPINGVPPPPGICRRCRVGPAEEKIVETKRVDEVVIEEDSNDVKIGIKSFLPDDDYLTNEEMRDQRGRAILRSLSQHRKETVEVEEEPIQGMEREITYRHVKMRQRSVSRSPSPLPRPPTAATSTSQDAIDAARKQFRQATISRCAPSVIPDQTANPSSEAKSESARRAAYSRLSKKVDALAEHASKPERSEAEIRRIAREEVERYRQAERLIEAHPDAYARGHMVPLERRLAATADVPVSMPWRDQPEMEEIRVVREREYAYAPPASPIMREERVAYEDKEKFVYEDKDKTAYASHRSDTMSGTRWDEVETFSAQHTHSEHRQVPDPQVSDHKTADSGRKSGYRGAGSKKSWGPKWLQQQQQVGSSVDSASSEKTHWPHTEPQATPGVEEDVGNPWDALSDAQTRRPEYKERQRQSRMQTGAPRAARTDEDKPTDSRAPEREYIYTVRTTTPSAGPAPNRAEPLSDDEYYSIREQRMYKRRSHAEQPSATQKTYKSSNQTAQAKADVSEHGSSRVRFAAKVEFSPTPPDSDASSAQFRQFGPPKHPQKTPGPQRGQVDGIAEGSYYEEYRGRTLSRERPPPQQQGTFRLVANDSQGLERQWDHASDKTLRPRKDSGDSHDTVPVLNRPLARALSESPSRERLNEAYNRPRSTDVEDGSNAPNQFTTRRRGE